MSLLKESINEFVRLSGIEEAAGMNIDDMDGRDINAFIEQNKSVNEGYIVLSNGSGTIEIEIPINSVYTEPYGDGGSYVCVDWDWAFKDSKTRQQIDKLSDEEIAEWFNSYGGYITPEEVAEDKYQYVQYCLDMDVEYRNSVLNEGCEKPLNEADSSSDDYDKAAPIRIYVGTYSKYNNGSLHGKWISLPMSEEELKKELAYVAQGEDDPEFMIQDYETDIPGLRISEYSSINDLNEKASMVGEIMDDEASRNALEAYLDKGYSFEEAIEAVNEGDWSYERADSETDLAYAIIDSLGGFENTLSKEQMDYYFDFEALGRDLRIEGAYNDEETGEEPDWIAEMSDEELGMEYADDVGIDGIANKEYYFDYERYGRDLAMDDYWKTTDGYVWCG